ncbi:unnamed protein product [Parajaminaea phylloscopi]
MMQDRWNSLAAFLFVVTAMAALTAEAVPTLRTYRGVSPYKALATGGLYPSPDAEPVQILNPRLRRHPKANWDPRLVPGLIRQPYGSRYNHRPQWADRAVKRSQSLGRKILRFASRFGYDLVKLARLSHPEAQWEAALDLAQAGHIWNSLDFETGSTVVLTNGTVLQKGADGSMPDLSSVGDSGFDYNHTPVRGVNIGNWLIAEFWMDPGYAQALNDHAVNAPYPNAIVDEWTAGQYSDYDYQQQVFKGHYESWFGEDDMRQIAEAGLNHVRIPIGFWAFGETNRNNEPYRTWNQYDKLIQACGWAKKYGLKVWIDLHGVPGSQNGFDNSGHTGNIEWPNDPDNISRTKYAFARLVKTFNGPEWYGTVTAFEAVNEPQGHDNRVLDLLQNDYYPWAIGTVKDNTKKRVMAFHDAFVTPSYWSSYFSADDAQRTILDTHQYYIYTDEEHSMSDSDRIREVCNTRSVMRNSKKHYVSVVGEFTLAAPQGDNGQHRDLPRKFSFSNDDVYSKAYKNFLAFNFRVQQAVFEQGNGWIMWAWKNGNRDWSYKTGIAQGWLPKNAQELNRNPLGSVDAACRIVGK